MVSPVNFLKKLWCESRRLVLRIVHIKKANRCGFRRQVRRPNKDVSVCFGSYYEYTMFFGNTHLLETRLIKP